MNDAWGDICYIHEVLRKNEFKQLETDVRYKLHITTGKFQTEKEPNNAYNDLKNLDESYTTMVDKISVEVIGNNEESIIVIKKML